MRRTSRIYLTNHLNNGKVSTLKQFINKYTNGVNYIIHRLWSSHDFSSDLADKQITDAVGERFGVTARLSQAITKQGKETVNSQKEKSENRKRMPRATNHVCNLDSRFVDIEQFKGCFDMCLKFGSGVPKMVVPFNWTEHNNKFRENGWLLSKSIRLGYNENGLFIDLIFEKQKPPKRTDGKLIGMDRGYNSMLFTSDEQQIGCELKDKIKKGGKRRKSYHHFITTEENRYLKQLNLDNVKAISIENLKKVKMNKRGKFPRNMNRLLSFWHYAKVGKRLTQLCEEMGVSIYLKSPWKTSQRCPVCGNIDRRNRKNEKFLCLRCGHTDNADHVGARNLEFLGLAGAYSLRSLPSSSIDEV